MVASVEEASREWSDALAAWAIPTALVDAAPESPYFFDPQVFIAAADDALARVEDTPSDPRRLATPSVAPARCSTSASARVRQVCDSDRPTSLAPIPTLCCSRVRAPCRSPRHRPCRSRGNLARRGGRGRHG